MGGKMLAAGLEWDPSEAKKWSAEEFEDNAKFLFVRGGDVEGTAENEVLKEIVATRKGTKPDKITADHLKEIATETGADEEAGTPDQPPADEFEPAKRGGRK